MRSNRIVGALSAGLAATAVAATLAAPAAAAAPGTYRPSAPYTGKVVRVIDGDTVDVRVGRHVRRVQLLDINAPERGQCWADAATRRIAWRLPIGSRVKLRQDGPARDAAGRYLAYVWNARGELVNRDLPRVGLAAVKLRPRGLYNAQALRDQEHAKRLRWGIWSDRCDVRGARSFDRDRNRWIGPSLLRKLRIDRDDRRGRDDRRDDRRDGDRRDWRDDRRH